jgi:hypothetical protein
MQNDPKIKLERFDTKEKHSIDPSSTILIVGSRRAGKTTYGKYLLSKIKEFYGLVIVFTHTKDSEQWDDLVEPDNIFEGYNPEVIDGLIERYKTLKKKAPDANRNVLVIFDDIIDDKRIRSDDKIESLFIRGRWLHIGVMFLTQYLNSVPPIVRTNTDIVIITIQSSLKAIDILYDSYGLVDKKIFMGLIKHYTENFGVFIIRNDKLTNIVKNKYQWDRAKIKI